MFLFHRGGSGSRVTSREFRSIYLQDQRRLRTSSDTEKFVINGTDGNWNRKSGWKLFLVGKWNLKI